MKMGGFASSGSKAAVFINERSESLHFFIPSFLMTQERPPYLSPSLGMGPMPKGLPTLLSSLNRKRRPSGKYLPQDVPQ